MKKAALNPHPRFRRRFWPLFVLGLAGIAILPLSLLPALQTGALAGALPPLPLPVLVALMLVNPLLLLAAFTALGAALAHRVGLHALLASEPMPDQPRWRLLLGAAPLALLLGLAIAVVTLLLDRAWQPLLSSEWIAAAEAAAQVLPLRALAVGVLYGGIAEEILLRWGLMSAFAWALVRLFARGAAHPPAAVMWCAIVLAALAFGAGHLPAAAAVAPLDAPLVLRTVLLNALAGLVFGWLYWRRHLEAAMLAHASTHLGFALLHWGGLL